MDTTPTDDPRPPTGWHLYHRWTARSDLTVMLCRRVPVNGEYIGLPWATFEHNGRYASQGHYYETAGVGLKGYHQRIAWVRSEPIVSDSGMVEYLPAPTRQ